MGLPEFHFSVSVLTSSFDQVTSLVDSPFMSDADSVCEKYFRSGKITVEDIPAAVLFRIDDILGFVSYNFLYSF